MKVDLPANLTASAGETPIKSREHSDDGSASAFFAQMHKIWNKDVEDGGEGIEKKAVAQTSVESCGDPLSLLLGASLFPAKSPEKAAIPKPDSSGFLTQMSVTRAGNEKEESSSEANSTKPVDEHSKPAASAAAASTASVNRGLETTREAQTESAPTPFPAFSHEDIFGGIHPESMLLGQNTHDPASENKESSPPRSLQSSAPKVSPGSLSAQAGLLDNSQFASTRPDWNVQSRSLQSSAPKVSPGSLSAQAGLLDNSQFASTYPDWNVQPRSLQSSAPKVSPGSLSAEAGLLDNSQFASTRLDWNVQHPVSDKTGAAPSLAAKATTANPENAADTLRSVFDSASAQAYLAGDSQSELARLPWDELEAAEPLAAVENPSTIPYKSIEMKSAQSSPAPTFVLPNQTSEANSPQSVLDPVFADPNISEKTQPEPPPLNWNSRNTAAEPSQLAENSKDVFQESIEKENSAPAPSTKPSAANPAIGGGLPQEASDLSPARMDLLNSLQPKSTRLDWNAPDMTTKPAAAPAAGENTKDLQQKLPDNEGGVSAVVSRSGAAKAAVAELMNAIHQAMTSVEEMPLEDGLGGRKTRNGSLWADADLNPVRPSDLLTSREVNQAVERIQAGEFEKSAGKPQEAGESQKADNMHAEQDASEKASAPPSAMPGRTDAAQPDTGRFQTPAQESQKEMLLRVGSNPAQAAESNNSSVLTRPAQATTGRPQELVFQLAEQIQIQVREGKSEIRIQLKPENLGNLEIKAETTVNGVVARIAAETSHVKSYLENNLHVLQQSLQDQGLKIERIQVTVQEGFDPQSSNGHGTQFGHAGSGHDGRESHKQQEASGLMLMHEPEEIVIDAMAMTTLNPDSTFHTVA